MTIQENGTLQLPTTAEPSMRPIKVIMDELKRNNLKNKTDELATKHNNLSLPGIYPAAGGRGIGGKTTTKDNKPPR